MCIRDRAGTTFAFRLREETGASPPIVARAYAAAREVFEMRSFWAAVEALDDRIEAQVGLSMLIEGRRLVERSARWLIGAGRPIDVEQAVTRFSEGARLLSRSLPEVLEGSGVEAFERRVAELRDAGVPAELSVRVAAMPALVAVFDVVQVAADTGHDLDVVMRTYFRLGSQLELNWLRDRIAELPRANRWQALARAALRDDLLSAHAELTRQVLEEAADDGEAIAQWSEAHAAALERALSTVADIRASRMYDTTTLPVALREVRALIRRENEPLS